MKLTLTNDYIADEGKHFVLTILGYVKSPEAVKPEREIGKPVKGFETKVPRSWVDKDYVIEREIK